MTALDRGILLDRILSLPDVKEVRIFRMAEGKTTVSVVFRNDASLGASNTNPCTAIDHAFTELRTARISMHTKLAEDIAYLDGSGPSEGVAK